MMPEQFIIDAHKILDRFGEWPSFHDSEIVRLQFDRQGELGPALEFTLFAWGWNGVVLPNGFYDRPNMSLIRFRCDGVQEENEFSGFNFQNVLDGLHFIKTESLIEVEMPSIFGVGGSFKCVKVTILEVAPADERGEPSVG